MAVTLVKLELRGNLSEGVRTKVRPRVLRGLAGTGLRVIEEPQARGALGASFDSCEGKTCWQAALKKLRSRFIVGGAVSGEDRSFIIELWMADAATNKVAAKVRQTCHICGLKAVAEKIELAASALQAKLKASAKAPARVALVSEPSGAAVQLDGKPSGQTPRELVLPARKLEIVIKADGYLPTRRELTLVAGVNERVTVRLIRAPQKQKRGLKIGGWAAVGAAAASFAVAGVLFAADNEPAGCSGEEAFPGGQCPEVIDSTAGAWSAVGIGVGAALGGAYLLWRAYRREAPRDVALLPGGLVGRF